MLHVLASVAQRGKIGRLRRLDELGLIHFPCQLANAGQEVQRAKKSGGRHKTAMLVDALEAVLAAMYLDGGLAPVKKMILQVIVSPELERMASNGSSLPLTDFKSALLTIPSRR